MESLLEGARHQRWLTHGDRPLGDGLGNGLDVHRLEVFLVQPRSRRLPGDAEDRYRVGLGGIKPRDHVGAGRA